MFSTLIAVVIVGIVVVVVQCAAIRLRTRYPAATMDLSILPALKRQYRWWAYMMVPGFFLCFLLLMVAGAAGLRAAFQRIAPGATANSEIIVVLPTAGILAFVWAFPLLSAVYCGLLQRRQDAWEQYKALSWQAAFGTLPRRTALRWVRKVRRAATLLLAVYYTLGLRAAASFLQSAQP